MEQDLHDYLEERFGALEERLAGMEARRDEQFAGVFARFARLELAFLRLAENIVSAKEVTTLQRILGHEERAAGFPPGLVDER